MVGIVGEGHHAAHGVKNTKEAVSAGPCMPWVVWFSSLNQRKILYEF